MQKWIYKNPITALERAVNKYKRKKKYISRDKRQLYDD